ncbi:MAG: DUF3465 domain-containing protein [Gammaproteobacteria bacterium]
MKKLILFLTIITLAYFSVPQATRTPLTEQPTASLNSDQILAQAYESRRSNLFIEGRGIVTRVLADDRQGNRHQRFIVQLASGQTLLIAHNIELAPRITDLKKGDPIAFAGEYEWNHKGGVIHWTHHDPSKRHAEGWLKHNGRLYR